MPQGDVTAWGLLALTFIVIELSTGAIYFLLLFAGALAGLASSALGSSIPTQIAVGAVVAAAGTLIWRSMRKKSPPSDSEDLDIGRHVQIDLWNENRTASTLYRGSPWQAITRDREPQTGRHRIVGLEGSILIVTQDKTI